MDRGPVALFGAIVAVGLGPAMWLGVQFGSIEVDPSRPPAIVGEPGSVPNRLVGGAADAPTTGAAVIDATPQSEVVPLTHSAKPSPSATTTLPTTAPTSSPTAEPSRSSEPTTPPTESAPTSPATDESTSPPAVPSPPASTTPNPKTTVSPATTHS